MKKLWKEFERELVAKAAACVGLLVFAGMANGAPFWARLGALGLVTLIAFTIPVRKNVRGGK